MADATHDHCCSGPAIYDNLIIHEFSAQPGQSGIAQGAVVAGPSVKIAGDHLPSTPIPQYPDI